MEELLDLTISLTVFAAASARQVIHRVGGVEAFMIKEGRDQSGKARSINVFILPPRRQPVVIWRTTAYKSTQDITDVLLRDEISTVTLSGVFI